MELFKKQILRFLSERSRSPVKLSSLARTMGVPDRDMSAFKAAVAELGKNDEVVVGARGIVKLPAMPHRVTGTFRANQKGFGFVIPIQPNSYGDLYIAPGETAGAMTGDKVIARSSKKGLRAGHMRYEGRVVEVLERGLKKFVGTLEQPAGQWIVRPNGKVFFGPVTVDDVTAKAAKAGDKVVVEIINYPTGTLSARGVIVEVLGKAGLYDTEIRSIIAQYNLPTEFDEDSLSQARAAAEHFDGTGADQRDDITDEVIITIDPPDAKDFDDAISLRKNADGNWVLGVHIADVSTFIPLNSPLDTEAKRRGNSVYLPAKVIPMLPEVLSNGICSLQPGQKRFTKSAYITYDDRGNVLDRNYANSIIRSTARLTYRQADMILKGKAAGFAGEVVALLKDMEVLAKLIENRRAKNGMLHLDLPEIELVLDDSGRVVDAEPADDCYPHTIIEMFMVEANEAVASMLDRFNVPFMRRIHPEPDTVGLKNLSRFVKICGLKVPRHLDRAAIQDLLAAAKGTSYSYPINLYILQSMQRAEYSPMHIGHFALASKHYAHFTSPIRRYADLTIHRLLQCYLEHHLNQIGLEEVLPDAELTEIGNKITFTEQQAANAEQELKTVLILQMLSDHIGDELDCVISSLTNFGLFARCTKYGIEGLIQLGDLGLDEWRYDSRAQAVQGVHSGKSVHLGQPMRTRIVAVNVGSRQLELAPVELLVDSRTQLNTPQDRKKAKRSQKQRRKQR